MTAEEYLNKLVDIDKRISAIRRAIEKCYARAESTSPQSSDIPPSFTGGTSRKIEDSVVMIADYKTELEMLCKSYEQMSYNVLCITDSMPDSRLAALIINKYINGMSWERTAEALDREANYTRKVLGPNAIKMFKKFYQTPEKALVSPLPREYNDNMP